MSRRTIAIAAALSVLALGSPLNVVRANPSFDQYVRQGVESYNSGNYRGALAAYTKAIEIDPQIAELYNYRGDAKRNLQDFQGAIVDYTKAIEINPQAEEAYLNRGVSKARLKDFQGSISDFTKAIQIKPQDAQAYYNRALSKSKSKDLQGSIADYTKTIELKPQHANAYLNRGIDREIVNDLKGACLDWRKAAGLGKENAAEWVKKQCQASTSAQQMEWEKMLVGESAEADQAAAEGYSLRGEGVPDGVPFSIEGKPAPDDFVDAQCINEDDVREPCKLKVDRINKAIGIWTPPGRVSSRLSIFKGSCLDAGCVLQNPDYGYPEEYRGTTKVVSWSGEHGGLLLRQDHGYEFEVVPLTPFSF